MPQIQTFDSTKERPIGLADAAKILPKNSNGKKLHVRTIERWIRRGLRGIQLEGGFFGGSLATSRESIDRFQKKLTEAKGQSRAARAIINCPGHEEAIKALKEAGF